MCIIEIERDRHHHNSIIANKKNLLLLLIWKTRSTVDGRHTRKSNEDNLFGKKGYLSIENYIPFSFPYLNYECRRRLMIYGRTNIWNMHHLLLIVWNKGSHAMFLTFHISNTILKNWNMYFQSSMIHIQIHLFMQQSENEGFVIKAKMLMRLKTSL